ncbi:MAG: hypothetical protein LIQ30_01150 [Planctomycetes bacterium]|nr:hypothetical protein [Planctomycetota bacterium]
MAKRKGKLFHFAKSSQSALALKKTMRFFALAVLLLCALSYGMSRLFTEDVVIRTYENAWENLQSLWTSYKHYFIEDGRVVRPKNNYDTVSEGQAYAMLRAVWMNDRETFDSVYRWTEEHLSRQKRHGDHLLAWRYGQDNLGNYTIQSDTPALDADLDYALALFLANRAWPDGRSPVGTMGYREKAVAVADSIMTKAVHLHPDGELVLLPWPLTGGRDPARDILVNPSYFSPGHYRIFEAETGNRRWGKLASDTYRQVERLLRMDGPDGVVVTVPDWILMRPDGNFAVDPNRGYVSGWDAFRLWWRLRFDYELGGGRRAEDIIRKRLVPFLDKSMGESGGDVASESDRDGVPTVKYSNSGMAAVYRWAVRDFEPVLARNMERQAMRRLQRDGEYLFFQERDEYYTNSWAWFAVLDGELLFPFGKYYSFGRIPQDGTE